MWYGADEFKAAIGGDLASCESIELGVGAKRGISMLWWLIWIIR